MTAVIHHTRMMLNRELTICSVPDKLDRDNWNTIGGNVEHFRTKNIHEFRTNPCYHGVYEIHTESQEICSKSTITKMTSALSHNNTLRKISMILDTKLQRFYERYFINTT